MAQESVKTGKNDTMVNLIDLNKNKHLFRRKSSLISSQKYYKINLKDITESAKERIDE